MGTEEGGAGGFVGEGTTVHNCSFVPSQRPLPASADRLGGGGGGAIGPLARTV